MRGETETLLSWSLMHMIGYYVCDWLSLLAVASVMAEGYGSVQ